MKQGRLLLNGIAALGIFGLGYLAGKSGESNPTGDASSPSSTSHRDSTHHSDTSDSTTKPKPRTTMDDTVPSPERNFSRRIVAMMSTGELGVNEVAIDGERLQPGAKVKEFLDLTDEQLETMKQVGRERLQAKQDHERSIAKVLKRTDDEVIFDIPADPAFATEQKEAYIESLRKEFGPDVAAVLQTSICQAYIEFTYPRHVRFTLSPNPNPIPEIAPPEIRAMMEGSRVVKTSVNQNEDGTWMTDDLGMMIPGGSSSTGGSVNINDTKPDAWFPRYHYLLKQ